MRIDESSLLRDPIFRICIIGIPLCVIGIIILGHDPWARSVQAEKELIDEANTTTDCSSLNFMTMDHQGDWFPDTYIKIAEQREKILKC